MSCVMNSVRRFETPFGEEVVFSINLSQIPCSASVCVFCMSFQITRSFLLILQFVITLTQEQKLQEHNVLTEGNGNNTLSDQITILFLSSACAEK